MTQANPYALPEASKKISIGTDPFLDGSRPSSQGELNTRTVETKRILQAKGLSSLHPGLGFPRTVSKLDLRAHFARVVPPTSLHKGRRILQIMILERPRVGSEN